MTTTIEVSVQQYSSLVSLARRGVLGDQGATLALETFLRDIEKQNSLERDFVWVQWQEAGAELPPGTRFPETWPPEMRQYIELITRKVSKADVTAVLETHAVNPVNVLVTRDPAGLVGWTTPDALFIT